MKALLPRIIIPLVALLLGVGGAVAATMFLDLPFLPARAAAATTDKTAAGDKSTPAKPVVPEHGEMYPLRERIVNLADSGGALRYLKSTIVLEVVIESSGGGHAAEDPKKKLASLQAAMADTAPVIEDTVNVILTAKTSAELMTTDGKVKLKDEIKSRVNKALHEEKVLNVYLTDFIIQ